MTPIHLQRCFHHAQREAVARCPACGRFFCRECVSEHEGRLLCASCLRRQSSTPVRTSKLPAPLLRSGAVLVGFMLAWLFFYSLGAVLIQITAGVHELKLDEATFPTLEE